MKLKTWTIPVILFLGLSVYLSFQSISKHINFESSVDLALYENVIWNTIHGNFYRTTIGPFPEIGEHNFLADHIDFILLIYLPFYSIFSSTKLLLILEAIIISSAIFPIYLLARENLKYPLLYPLVFAFYFPIYSITLFDFHPETAFIPLLVWFHYFSGKESKISYLLFPLILICKEEVVLITFLMGFLYWWEGRKKQGRIILLGSAAYFLLALISLSIFNPISSEPFHIQRFLHPHKPYPQFYATLLFLFLPLAFLPLLSKYILLVFPYLVYTSISTNANQSMPFTHHTFIAVPSLFIAAIDGQRVLERTFKGRLTFLNFAPILPTLILFYWIGPLSPRFPFSVHREISDPKKYAELFQELGKESGVFTEPNILPHFSRRREIRVLDFHKKYSKDEVLVLSGLESEERLEFLERHKLSHPSVFRDESIIILKKLDKD